MIAASEPLEFIPRGRQAVEEHPGPMFAKKQPNLPSEHMLLYRMQNVNLSADEESTEFWSIREIYKDCQKKSSNPRQTENSTPVYMTDCYANSEEEIYVKKCTAVWSKGLMAEGNVLPRMCFTCDTPIKFAFFCNPSFVIATAGCSKKTDEDKPKADISAICMIDSNSLRIYCSNGEDYLANLEFPVSNVWNTKYGILLEKEASSTIIESHSISMPRIFSLTHPLDEMCPVLNKSANGTINYLTEADFKMIFSTPEDDLIFLYDNKMGRHFVAKLRKALEDEINAVGCHNDTVVSGFNQTHRLSTPASACSFSQNSLKISNIAKNTSAVLARSSLGAGTTHTIHISKFLNATGNPQLHSTGTPPTHSLNRSNVQSSLNRLQSTLGGMSTSYQDIRKLGQTQPSKPIFPEFCLEHIWTESVIGKDFCEIASKAFTHTDIVGQSYLCYLLPRSCKLQLVRLERISPTNTQVFGQISVIPAKDAVVLERMKMIAILAPCGTLVLYTGSVMISKVHIAGKLSTGGMHRKSMDSPFPRRSSLLPTAPSTETKFDDELHLLSPVHPLQPQLTRGSSGVCVGLRDPAGNRLTLVYPDSKMFRISLPLINESHFITKCIDVLRQVLTKDLFVQLISRWYGARNSPGSQDFSAEQEWETFRNVLSESMGRCMTSNESNSNLSLNAGEPKKRRKNDEESLGTEEDWNYLQSVLGRAKIENVGPVNEIKHNDQNAFLFSQIPLIFYTLHLLYEDMKLQSFIDTCSKYLAEFLYQLAKDMRLDSYCLHYLSDFPNLITIAACNLFTDDDAQLMHQSAILSQPVPNVFQQVNTIIHGRSGHMYTCVDRVNTMSRNVLQLVSLICHGHTKIKSWIEDLKFPGTFSAESAGRPKRMISTNIPRSEQVIQMLIHMDLTRTDIERLPASIHLMISESLEHSRLSPPIGSSPETYELILRSELAEHAKFGLGKMNVAEKFNKSNMDAEDSLSHRYPPTWNALAKTDATSMDDDGMDNIDTKLLRLRFPDDLRVAEVRRLLNSSDPVLIDITQSPGVSDHEFIEEQEKQLYAMCTRTMTLPVGRGMFTLRTLIPTPTESMPIPKLCLTGREPVKGATIEMQQIEFPSNMSLWPSFHNGVAAGLRVSHSAKDIDSTWIVYNKPRGQTDTSTEHAGFLMALGLNGHLKTLSFMSIYEYLVKCDEMTSVGLLLGISATHRGTMNNTTTKLLSVHIEALLPATALELDIPQNIQVASLMGIGLIYQGTAKRHIAEVLLQEIGRPPGPEMENSIERESYALTAGLALGLVTLGQGESPPGLRDLQLPDTLHYYMVGGNKRQLSGSQKEKYKLPSFQVREGDTVNIDVTAPGATLALGLMFFNTGNKSVAEWMKPPDTSYLLDLIRPDLLLLRIIAKGLILWDEIQADSSWLFGQYPANLAFDIKNGPSSNRDDVDHEANAQAFCNIVAGAAFCIGLKFAGTENPEAFKVLKKTIKLFLSIQGQYAGEFAGKVTVESSLILTLISISLVYAGTGHLQILRMIRYLRSRIGPSHSQVTYGSQMGIHMALGFLFLGAGRYTLSRSPEAIAALICALFPKFPNHSNDNRYHLQAFRHLYVLAVEPRLFLPRDIDSKTLCLCKISCIDSEGKEVDVDMAPCMLPPLDTLQSVIVDDENYWPVSFERGRNWNQLLKILESSGCIDIKKREGCLSHIDDPDRLKSLLVQTLTSEKYGCWKIDLKSLIAFSSEQTWAIVFMEKFMFEPVATEPDKTTYDEMERSYLLMLLFYKCLTKDKMHALPTYLSMMDALDNLQKSPSNSHQLWQFKIIDSYMQSSSEHTLISKEIVDSLLNKLKTTMEALLTQYSVQLKRFIASTSIELLSEISPACLGKVLAAVTYYGLPWNALNLVDLSGKVNYIRYLYEFRRLGLDVGAINSITKLMETS